MKKKKIEQDDKKIINLSSLHGYINHLRQIKLAGIG